MNDQVGRPTSRRLTPIRADARIAPGCVLVVDDVRGNVQLATALLEREGYTVTAASTGRDALDAVARDQPDLILLDVMLPDLDGFEICRRLKADAATRLLPVVLLTARSDTAARIHGIEAGADDFITKPFNPPEIRARVRSLIRIKRYTDDL